tara:strand:+ start:161 stop:565 length:405 start_codon:yes stop_codon:yes gene_type:complete
MPVKKKLKTVKTNVVKLPKRNNVTLDLKPDGNYNTILDYYRTKNLERMFSIDDVLLLVPEIKKRTWCEWREFNKGKKREDCVGPEYVIQGRRIYKIKLIWILRYIKGHKWEPLIEVPVSATQSEEMKLRSLGSL